MLALLAGVAWFVSDLDAGPDDVASGLGEGQRGTVAQVVDGDTFRLRTGERVRILGIDTPEVHPEAECWGPEATEAAARLIGSGETVTLYPDPSQDSVDRYGRLLRVVETSEGTDVAEELVRVGAARVYVFDRPFARLPDYEAAQERAEDAGRGLWSC